MPIFLRWLLRLGPINPITVRLVQGGSRRPRHLYIRTIDLGARIVTLLDLLRANRDLEEFLVEPAFHSDIPWNKVTADIDRALTGRIALAPRYRAGFLKFNSDFDTPLADGNILVSYRFQFTEPNDILAVDYDSRQKMHITLSIRMYPQTTFPNVQNVTLTGEATVRNFTR